MSHRTAATRKLALCLASLLLHAPGGLPGGQDAAWGQSSAGVEMIGGVTATGHVYIHGERVPPPYRLGVRYAVTGRDTAWLDLLVNGRSTNYFGRVTEAKAGEAPEPRPMVAGMIDLGGEHPRSPRIVRSASQRERERCLLLAVSRAETARRLGRVLTRGGFLQQVQRNLNRSTRLVEHVVADTTSGWMQVKWKHDPHPVAYKWPGAEPDFRSKGRLDDAGVVRAAARSSLQSLLNGESLLFTGSWGVTQLPASQSGEFLRHYEQHTLQSSIFEQLLYPEVIRQFAAR